jgi:hypothetical protein
MIGPFIPNPYPGLGSPSDWRGAHVYREIVSNTTINIEVPTDMSAGSYYVYVIGNDGQVGVYPTPYVIS